MTPEQVEDLKKRVKAFNEELIPLLAKHKLALGAQPTVNGAAVPASEFIGAIPKVFDDSVEEKSEEETKIAAA